MFPEELLPYTTRKKFGKGGIKVNFLVNYSWKWDLDEIKKSTSKSNNINNQIQSNDISRVDLIIRWGGRRRLSGFLPVQSIYADFYVIDDYWPDFKAEHFYEALCPSLTFSVSNLFKAIDNLRLFKSCNTTVATVGLDMLPSTAFKVVITPSKSATTPSLTCAYLAFIESNEAFARATELSNCLTFSGDIVCIASLCCFKVGI